MVLDRRSPPFEVMFVTPDPGPAPSAEQIDDLVALVRGALAGGVDAVQLRAKELASGPLFALALTMLAECAPRGAVLIVNDRLDVALASGAGGVQLGERSLPVAAAARLAGSLRPRVAGNSVAATGAATGKLLIGASVHDAAGIRAAVQGGADYLVYGNVYATASKPGLAGKGLEALSGAVSAAGNCPLLAIGGVVGHNAGAVKRAGARGIAVIGAIAGARSPEAAAAALVAAWRMT